MEKSGHKKKLSWWRALGGKGEHRISAFLSAQVIVQVFVFRIVAGFIADTSIIHPGNGLCGSLPGKVIVEITVDDRIFL